MRAPGKIVITFGPDGMNHVEADGMIPPLDCLLTLATLEGKLASVVARRGPLQPMGPSELPLNVRKVDVTEEP